MEQQTAVEWFYQRILAEDIKEIFEQAKQIEKEQIKDAHNHGEYNSQFMDALDDINGIEYYNKTYTK
jgi:hemoglobin-like flavoprotein